MKLRTCGLPTIAALVFCFLASAQALAQNAYITNSGSNTVSVIDTAANKVIATIPVGTNSSGVAMSPDGSKVYVAGGGTPGSGSVIATIPVGEFPQSVAVSPDGKGLCREGTVNL